MEFKPIETQEAFDAAIKSRLERERKHAAEQFSDYDELKEKAAKFDKLQGKTNDDLTAANARIAELEDAAKKRAHEDELMSLRQKVSTETGVPIDLINGDDEESMNAFASKIADFAHVPAAPNVPGAGTFSTDSQSGASAEMRDFVSQLTEQM